MNFVGLGNPGYELTRHNLGFMAVEHIAKELGVKFSDCGPGLICSVRGITLFKPNSFMNISGEKIKKFVDKFKIDVKELCVIHDDMDIPAFALRIKRGGGAGGHRGVESVIKWLGTREFLRIRLGIGRPTEGITPTEWVLSRFSKDEIDKLEDFLRIVFKTCMAIVEDGEERAMTIFNVMKPS